MPRFAESLAELERWLLPAACLLCEAPIASREGDALVCALCRSRWRPVPGPRCERCGQPAFAEGCQQQQGEPAPSERQYLFQATRGLVGTVQDFAHFRPDLSRRNHGREENASCDQEELHICLTPRAPR